MKCKAKQSESNPTQMEHGCDLMRKASMQNTINNVRCADNNSLKLTHANTNKCIVLILDNRE